MSKPTFPTPVLTAISILVTDLVALYVALGLTIVVRQTMGGRYELSAYTPLWPVVGVFVLAFTFAGLYPGVPFNAVDEIRRIVTAVTFVFLVLGLVTFFLRDADAWSRAVFLVSWPVSCASTVCGRAAVRHALARKKWWGVPVVVLGAGSMGRRVADTLRKSPWLGLKVLAILDDSHEALQGWADRKEYLLGGLELTQTLANDAGVSYGIIAMPNVSSVELVGLVARYGCHFRQVLVMPGLYGMSSLWVTARDVGGMLGLEIRQVLLNTAPRILKRGLDVVLTVAGGLLLAPVILVTCAAVKLTSAGPIFYSQPRIGRDKRTFRAWKFRTMVSNADEVLATYVNTRPDLCLEWQRDHKLRDDPRVTRLGKILRRTSLDELPQLWNVLRGEMSLVGPRPIVDDEIRKYGTCFPSYCRVRPGLTGLWQVSGRNDTGYDERVQLDEFYVRNWSVWLDLYILARTASAVLRASGAY